MKRNKYRHIFFDLDHTLWDFEKNSDETLSELFDELKLADIGAKSFENFMSHYREQNQYCWTQYRNGKMTKEEVRVKRFLYTFEALEMKRKDLAIVLSDLYVSRSPEKRNLIEGSMELLDHLKEKYALHIITNGFEEVQYKKIKGRAWLLTLKKSLHPKRQEHSSHRKKYLNLPFEELRHQGGKASISEIICKRIF